MSLWDTIGSGLKAMGGGFRFSGMGGNYGFGSPFGAGGLGRFLAGTEYDYRREAGILWENSIVLPCLNWKVRTLPEAPPQLEKRDTDGKWKAVPDTSGVIALLEKANEDYDSSVLQAGTEISWTCDGNAYWFKQRSRAHRVVGYYYVPHFQMEPRWPTDGSQFISHYEYFNGESEPIKIRKEDVVHLRNGMDPLNSRKGLSDLGGCLREICTDNEAGTFSAAMLRNFGIPGVVISPKESTADFTDDQRKKIDALWQEKFGRDRRGSAWVSSLALDVNMPGFSPEQLVIEKVRRIPEERITAAIGLPAVVVGLGAGLDASSDKHNIETANKMAWLSCLIPQQRTWGKQITRQTLPDFVLNADGVYRIGWDYSSVKALQEDQTELLKALEVAAGGPVLTPNEAREALNKPPQEGGDKLRDPKPVGLTGAVGPDGKPMPKPTPETAKKMLEAMIAQALEA